jgi:ASC-1-like (ASCH) protein
VKRILVMAAALLVVTAVAASAEPTVKKSTKGGKPYFEAKNTQTTTAQVIKINLKSRVVRLAGESGDTVDVKVKPEVKTLDQIKVGDTIKLTYDELFTVHVESGKSNEKTTAAAQESNRTDAQAGQTPSTKLTEKRTYKATITAIDEAAGTATLQGADGVTATVTPEHKENLKKVKVGDRVVFTYTEALSANVEKVTK